MLPTKISIVIGYGTLLFCTRHLSRSSPIQCELADPVNEVAQEIYHYCGIEARGRFKESVEVRAQRAVPSYRDSGGTPCDGFSSTL
jgi:hypothetical protein